MPAPQLIQDGSRNAIQATRQGACQRVAIGAASAQSTAVNVLTRIVRLVATGNCHYKIAANPTAVADGTSSYLPAGAIETRTINGSQKIAVIQDGAATGFLYIEESY